MADSKDIINGLGGTDKRLNDMHAIKEVLSGGAGGGGGIDITAYNTPCEVGKWLGKKVKMVAIQHSNTGADQSGSWGVVEYRPTDFTAPLMAWLRGGYSGGDNGKTCSTPCAVRDNYNSTKLEVMGNWPSGKLPYKQYVIMVYISNEDA